MTTGGSEKAEETPDFRLTSSSAGFAAKQESVFGALSTLERKHEAYERVRSHKDDSIKADPVADPVIDDRERRRPRRGSTRRPPLPMYRREPKKWTMYDLSDLDPATMSERSTKAAALSFLSDLKKRKKSETVEHEVVEDKIVFKKPKIERKELPSVTTSGARVMPEYNFGEKKAKKRKESGPVAAGAGIHLSHLDEEED